MVEELYNKRLMRLAAEARGAGRLSDADATATVDNPLCGDRVTIDVRLANGRVAAVAHEVKACVLCQAAASVIGSEAAGRDRAEIEAVAGQVEGFLKRGEPLPAGAWPELDAFAPVVPHKSRHRCVLLSFEALLRALTSG
jgi:NifU-like protein involved in Fe-S cluster formation